MVVLLGLGLQQKSVDQLAGEFDRILSPESGDLASSRILGEQDNKLGDTLGLGSFVGSPNFKLGTASDAVLSGFVSSNQTLALVSPWVKRIRGLLYVILCELTNCINAVLGKISDTEVADGIMTLEHGTISAIK
ncbi:unnamed protein product, partial [Protopolystoma xenopodis]